MVRLARLGIGIYTCGLVLQSRQFSWRRATIGAQKAQQRYCSKCALCSGHDANMHGVLLHCVADAMTRVGVIAGQLMVNWWCANAHLRSVLQRRNRFFRDWQLAHCLVGAFVGTVIVRLLLPLFRYTGRLLLQTRPPALAQQLERCIREVCQADSALTSD